MILTGLLRMAPCVIFTKVGRFISCVVVIAGRWGAKPPAGIPLPAEGLKNTTPLIAMPIGPRGVDTGLRLGSFRPPLRGKD